MECYLLHCESGVVHIAEYEDIMYVQGSWQNYRIGTKKLLVPTSDESPLALLSHVFSKYNAPTTNGSS